MTTKILGVFALLLALVTSMAVPSVSQASLLGDTVTSTPVATDPLHWDSSPASAVVGPGIEFNLIFIDLVSIFEVDVDDSTIELIAPFGGNLLAEQFVYTLGDLDWLPSPGSITGVNILDNTSSSGIDFTNISFTSDSVSIVLTASTWTAGSHLLLGLETATGVLIPVGMPSGGQMGGGSTTIGGVDVSFSNVTDAGFFNVEYNTPTLAELSTYLPPGAAPLVDFGLPGDPLQVWDLDFDGTFAGLATVTFGYDDTILTIPETSLGMYHYDDDLDVWEYISTGFIIDTVANTITIDLDSFSPFMLGAAPIAAVPEPSAASMAAVGLLGLAFWDWPSTAGDVNEPKQDGYQTN